MSRMAVPISLTPEISIHDDKSAIDAVLRRIRLLARRRLLWLTEGMSAPAASYGKRLFPATGDMPLASTAEIESLLNDRDDPLAEGQWQHTRTELNTQIGAVEEALKADRVSRLSQLIHIFALDDFDRDLLHICLAPGVDPALGRLYAYCQDNATRTYPTLALTARLCGHGRFGLWGSDSSLRRWRMISMVPDLAGGSDQFGKLTLDPTIRNWLSGVDEPDPLLVGRARLVRPLEPLPEWNVESAATFAAEALKDHPTRTVVIQIVAPPGSGRQTFAAIIASHLGMPLLAIDTTAISEDDWMQVFIQAHRHAFLHRVALAWKGGTDTAGAKPWTEYISHFPVQFILREAQTAAPLIPNAIELRVDLPAPAVATRQSLWKQYAPQAAAAFPDQVAELAERFNARPGAIVAAASIPGAPVQGMAQALRHSQRHLLDNLAQPLECPFAKDDLVATDTLHEALNDFIHEARDRVLFWEQPQARRLFPQGRGLAALFTGSPGTGKTMAAQVIAAQLGLDLFRIDLSAVVSKYVGETSHNLQHILSRAADMDVVLFFDEADALFSRRTEVKDAHDRFANTDTNHLLQALENYGGVALLATNRKGNIDPAFIRRLRYVLEFAKPDANQRLQLWIRLISALAGEKAAACLAPLIERLASEIELTGAQIKYAVLTAVFAARRDGVALRTDHLLRGLDREMAKEGRALSERERVRLKYP
ncbi:AAA family ATPase [Desulfobacca acetoxidans]